MRIHRYELDITDRQTVTLPLGYELLSVAVSRTDPNGLIDMWAQVPEMATPIPAVIHIIGTGNPMPDDLTNDRTRRKFLGTVVTPGGLVWHVFEGPVYPTDWK